MLNKQNLQSIINFIWIVADDVLINKFLENQYQDVILPMTVLRRLDLALEPTKDKVLKTNEEFKSKIDNLYGLLTSQQHGTGLAFYNTSQFTMKKLLADPKNIDVNFLYYLNRFSENVQDIISKFKFRNQLETFETTGITFSLIEKFGSASKQDIDMLVLEHLPAVLNKKQKYNKIHNIIYAMSRKDRTIKNSGTNRYPKWVKV